MKPASLHSESDVNTEMLRELQPGFRNIDCRT